MRKSFTLLMIVFLVAGSVSAQLNNLFNQSYYDGGSALTSALDTDAGVDYQVADNFYGLNESIEQFTFYGLALKYVEGSWVEQTPNGTEPFFIRFFDYEVEYFPGVIAPVSGTHQIALLDDWGDGWNGGRVTVYVNGYEVLTAITLDYGSGPEYFDFVVNAGDVITTLYTPGSYAAENYYAILDPAQNIIGEDGGTWDNPGTSVPTGISPGDVVLEPTWATPAESLYLNASVENAGSIWSGEYQLYKFTVILNTPVEMETAWISPQIDANSGSGTWFLWLNSLDGDEVSWQYIGESTPSKSSFPKVDLSKVSQAISTNDVTIFDMAFALYGGVQTNPPQCATNPFPANLATNVQTNVVFSWSGDPNAEGYKFYLGTDNPPTNLVNSLDLGAATNYTPTNELEYDTDYFWRVVPYNSVGSANSCDIWTFTTKAPNPPGSTCEKPYPTTLPLVDFAGNTNGMGDDYSSSWITPGSSYLNGDDMVFEFTLTEASYLNASMTSPDSYIGLFITKDCPDLLAPAQVLKSATSSGSSVSFTELTLQPATYFAIVSSWPDPQSIEFTLNLWLTPLPSCATPTSPNATNVSTNSANLSWTENGTATVWDIEYGTTGFVQGTGTIVSNVTNPYTLTGLQSGTSYTYYVRANCGGGSFSNWSVASNFTTQFLFAPPYVQGFQTNSAPAGWSTTGWTIGSVRGVTGNPGNNIYRNFYTATVSSFSITNVGPVSTGMQLTFDYKLANYATPYAPPASGSGNYTVALSTDFGANFTDIETVENNAVAGWQSKVYDLSAYNGQNIKVKITGVRFSGDYDLAFDNFRIGLPITCYPPTNVEVSDIDKNTATISWTAPSPAPTAGYQWEVRNGGGVVIASGSTAAGITTTGVTGLSAGSSYFAFVRSNCGQSYSDWSLPASFNTLCEATSLPYYESFDYVTAPAVPTCITVTDDNGDDVKWVTTSTSSYVRSAPNSMRISYSPILAMDDWFFTQALSLQPGAYNVSFWYKSSGIYYPEALEVKWGTAPNAAGMTSEAIFDNNNIINSTFIEGTATFVVASAGEYYVGWHGYSDVDQFYLIVDDIAITEAPVTKSLNLSGIMLEGLYDGSGTMHEATGDSGPQFGAGNADVVDIELHNATDYSIIEHTISDVLLSTTGGLTINDIPGSFNGDYFITIKHRNSIETTTANPVSFASGSISYSFATPADVYGGNLIMMTDGFYAIFSGDVNQDRIIDTQDIGLIDSDALNFAFGYFVTDVNGDGIVDTNDISIADRNQLNFVTAILP